ncbi:hypothetical protein CRD60_02740 [Bifidobacterium aemilianum]|uniref:Polymer-forming cytoskeletal protein n=1 Tax=Bifidobacterium aemilianum TaxID=2493120 RepID=A0A366K9U8_9BIFI|nr:hypothetical protein [Bifidobacterium aemilianum]RBP98097.1 hypothetical protein CRD60_02740 [Bifidobacterium aemilianum]
MRIGQVIGHGDLWVEGDLLCGSFNFIGHVHVTGHIVCDTSFQHTGSLDCRSLEAGELLDLHESTISVVAMYSPLITIHGFQSPLLNRLGTEHERLDTPVGSISCRELKAGDLQCASVEADDVELTGSCRVEKVTYGKDIRYNRGSVIGSIRKDDGERQARTA